MDIVNCEMPNQQKYNKTKNGTSCVKDIQNNIQLT